MPDKNNHISNNNNSTIITGRVSGNVINTTTRGLSDELPSGSTPLTPLEQHYVKQICSLSGNYLPGDLKPYFLPLAELIAQIVVSLTRLEDTPPPFTQKVFYKPLIDTLAGQEIPLGQTLISFGSQNQIGDVHFRDIASGNIYKITLNVGMNAKP